MSWLRALSSAVAGGWSWLWCWCWVLTCAWWRQGADAGRWQRAWSAPVLGAGCARGGDRPGGGCGVLGIPVLGGGGGPLLTVASDSEG